MTITNVVKKICSNLGNNSRPIYPILAISCANGIFRPTFTMLKKGENPESKKYAALREGITELVAMPTYFLTGILGEKLGEKIAVKAHEADIAKRIKAGDVISETVKQEMKASAIKKGQAGLGLIAICIAAGVVIPALCSVVVTPIMKKIGKKPEETPKKLDIKENAVPVKEIPVQPLTQINRPIFNNWNSGMKVGGV